MGAASGLLIAAGTATTNPDPNTIGPTFTVVTATDIVTTSVAHGKETGQAIQVAPSGAGVLPTGLVANTNYFVRVLTPTTFTLHATAPGALANTGLVNITSTGTTPYVVAPIFLYPNTPSTRQPRTIANVAWDGLADAGTIARALVSTESINTNGQTPVLLNFFPSAGSTTTYTVDVWRYNESYHRANPTAKPWLQPEDSPRVNATGSLSIYLANPDSAPWFIQLSDISSGTVAVWYDNVLMEAI